MATVELSEVIAALQAVAGQKSASGTPSTPYYTGPQGLFGVSQTPDRDVFSTRVVPRGLIAALPWKPSNFMYPLFPYLTGFRATSGSNPTNVCDACPTPGSGKSCYQTAQFGRFCYHTRELEVNRVGQKIDRGELWDGRIVNDPLAGELASLWPGMPEANSLINGREMLARMIELGVAFQNLLCAQLYTGNPANNTAGGGYKEFPGLDILIGTTKVDALTGTDCPSLDALVRDWNYGLVTNMNLDLVREVAYIARFLKHNASTMNYDPTQWVITMREGLFYELTSVWPCAYLSHRCYVPDSAWIDPVGSVNVTDAIRLRDDMRNGKYLLIDGVKWNVVFDDCITEEDTGDTNRIGNGCYASDIYFIPMTVLGGMPVTYMEYFDYASGSVQGARDANYATEFWSDGGRVLWAREPNLRWCTYLSAKMEPRLIFKAPFLSARLTNVQYCPLIHEREPLPAQHYFVDGGVQTPRAAPSYYSDWNNP